MANVYPTFATPVTWNSQNTYDALKIVLYDGGAYTSKSSVPAGVQISNTDYWIPTGNFYKLLTDYINNLQSAISTLDQSVVKKSGSTMSGNLGILKSTPEVFLKSDSFEISVDATNNVTSDRQIAYVDVRDANNRTLSYYGYLAYTDGSVRSRIRTTNMKTDGTEVSAYFDIRVTKDGTISYNVPNPSGFRSAIQAEQYQTVLLRKAEISGQSISASGSEITVADFPARSGYNRYIIGCWTNSYNCVVVNNNVTSANKAVLYVKSLSGTQTNIKVGCILLYVRTANTW